MSCVNIIRSCAPYMDKNEFYSLMVKLCDTISNDPCVKVVPAGTSEDELISVGWSGILPIDCPDMFAIYDDGTKAFVTSTSNINWKQILHQPKEQLSFRVSRSTDQTINTGSPVTGIYDFDTIDFNYKSVDTVNNKIVFPFHYNGWWKMGVNFHFTTTSTYDKITVRIKSNSISPIPNKVYLIQNVNINSTITQHIPVSGIFFVEEDQELEVEVFGDTASAITLTRDTFNSNQNLNVWWGFKMRGMR